jgi:hypothetical protein
MLVISLRGVSLGIYKLVNVFMHSLRVADLLL